tara:strand:+ start:31 stop:810 length:780 start_codon:yes stop_codon:yes gene_type:complete
MGSSAISLGLGLGGGKSATSSGGSPGGGSFVNQYALNFDGSDESMSIGNNVVFNTAAAFSFSAWVKLDAFTNNYPALLTFKTDQSQAYMVGFSRASGYNGVFLGSPADTARLTTDSTAVADDLLTGWKHICITYNGASRTVESNYKLYIDSTSKTLVISGGFGGIQNDNYIGRSSAGYYIDGLIDELATFGSELSASQVSAIYNSGVPADLSSTTGWWRMGDGGSWDGTNWTIPDASGNGNNGTTVNMEEASRVTTVPT